MPPIASFEEEKQLVLQAAQEPRGMSGWLVKKGLAANQASANLTLIVLVTLCLGVGVFVAFRGLSGGEYLARQEMNEYVQKMKNVQKLR